MCTGPEPWITSGRHVSSQSETQQATNMADTSAQTVPGLPGWIFSIKDGNGKNQSLNVLLKQLNFMQIPYTHTHGSKQM